ncbi:conserved protein, unknown function [Hepatocystis sp. ex Piliocolobus tephrosceles]|nr:conserved protein, unknown function [Hepatocystis sp. ex Piliocolobus tephrosceles]
MQKSYKQKKNSEQHDGNKKKGSSDNMSNLMHLKIRNENVHIKNIIRTTHYVYSNIYDADTGLSYIKDVLRNIIKGDVYDIDFKKYVNEYCICELCARLIFNIIKSASKDEYLNRLVDFLFDMLYYCDILLNEKKTKKDKQIKSSASILVNKNKTKNTNTNTNDNNNNNNNNNSTTQEFILITKLWNRLLDNIYIKDRKQRINLCKVIKELVKKACSLQIDISDKLCKKHVNTFLSLLNDKDHTVRMLCLIILEPFQDINTKNSYLKCLEDIHSGVRIQAIKNMMINIDNNNNNYEYLIILRNLLVRINDINHNVRVSVYDKLKNYFSYIPSDMKFELILCGLNDKNKIVRDTCYSMIIHWAQLFDDKIEKLLLHMITSDIDNDIIVEHICKFHLNIICKGRINNTTDFYLNESKKNGGEMVGGNIKKTRFSNENFSRTSIHDGDNVDTIDERGDIGDGEDNVDLGMGPDISTNNCNNIDNTIIDSIYNEEWFINCISNLFLLNTADLYILRFYIQHFASEIEKEKIDVIQLLQVIYYYLHLSKLNENFYYNRKYYINYIENKENDTFERQHLYCTCGKSKKNQIELEQERQEQFIETNIFDTYYCDKCLYYKVIHDDSNNKTKENETEEEILIINEDNINENYTYICNIKNLLIICKQLDIIETYQIEKIIECCSNILLKAPLRENIVKCMLNNTGVNYYKLQKGHITCAYWLVNSYIYSCLDLLKHMIYLKNKNLNIIDIEMSFTNQILTIISDIKEPFETNCDDNNVMFTNNNIIRFEEKENKQDEKQDEKRDEKQDEKQDEDLSPNHKQRQKQKEYDQNNMDGIGNMDKSRRGSIFNEDNKKTNILGSTFNAILNVENDSIFDIIRKKNLNTLSIEHLLLLCKKMHHKLDVTEAKIKDLSDMEREKKIEMEKESPKKEDTGMGIGMGGVSGNGDSTDENLLYGQQIKMNTNIFLKQFSMLCLLRLELKRRWLRILLILECFLCKCKSHCDYDSGLREFPNELLLPALNFCCSIMPEWDDKEIEDQFYDIIVSKCLGSWCMFISNEEELKKQIYAYKTAIEQTCDVLNSCLIDIENIHLKVFPKIYQKANIDIISLSDKGAITLTNTSGNSTTNKKNNSKNERESYSNNNNIGNNNIGNNNIGNNGKNGKKNENELDITNNNFIFYEYTPPNECLLKYFATNQNTWFEYKDLLEKLEINSLRFEIYICVLSDLLMTHPNFNNDTLIVEAIEHLWCYLTGTINTSKYIQSICLRVCCKLLLTEYLGQHITLMPEEDLYKLMKKSATKLRALFEMCFLISPCTYNCIQDFKKISTSFFTNINVHDKIYLFSVFSLYPSITEYNLIIFHYTFEDLILKTCEDVVKLKLKKFNYTNILTFVIFTILHKASINFLALNFVKYIKWLLLIIIEKGLLLTNRSNIIELVYKIIYIYLFNDINNVKNIHKTQINEEKQVKKRGRKKKIITTDSDGTNLDTTAITENTNLGLVGEDKKKLKKGSMDITYEHGHDNKHDVHINQAVDTGTNNNVVDLFSQKESDETNTILYKSVQINVNNTMKNLKILFVLINFCMHSPDVIKTRSEIRYCEHMKELIESKMEEIKTYFIKNKLIVTEKRESGEIQKEGEVISGYTNTDETENKDSNNNLFDLNEFESLSEESIYGEIIEEYANYIETLTLRKLAYPLKPKGLYTKNVNDEMTRNEIFIQIGGNDISVNKLVTTDQESITSSTKKNTRLNTGMNEHPNDILTHIRTDKKMYKSTKDYFWDTHENNVFNEKSDDIINVKNVHNTYTEKTNINNTKYKYRKENSLETILSYEKTNSINTKNTSIEGIDNSSNSTNHNKKRKINKEETKTDVDIESDRETLTENNNLLFDRNGNKHIGYNSNKHIGHNNKMNEMIDNAISNSYSFDMDNNNINDKIKNKLAELNLSSSENESEKSDDSSSLNDYESKKKNYKNDMFDDDNSSCDSFNSDDSAAMAFKRIKRLKRSSYTHVVSK